MLMTRRVILDGNATVGCAEGGDKGGGGDCEWDVGVPGGDDDSILLR